MLSQCRKLISSVCLRAWKLPCMPNALRLRIQARCSLVRLQRLAMHAEPHGNSVT